MTTYLIRRLAQAVGVVLSVSLLVYLVMTMFGDPAALIAGDLATPQDVERIRHSLGLDRPWYEQWIAYVAGFARGEWGMSIWQKRPVWDVVTERIPATVKLALAVIPITILLSIPSGVFAAVKRNSAWDRLIMVLALSAYSIPGFFLGVILLWVGGGLLRWFPIGGSGDGTLFDDVHHLVLPALALGLSSVGRMARLVRSSVLDVIGQDFTRTARAKGLREVDVISRHVVRNALIPAVTLFGFEVGQLLSGAVIVETVFGYPGVGLMTVSAIAQADFPVVIAAVMLLSLVYVAVNLIVDLSYGFLDPRIRLA